MDITKNHIPKTQLEVFDITGKVFISQPIMEGMNSIKTKSLPKGLYFIKISDRLRLETFNLIKE